MNNRAEKQVPADNGPERAPAKERVTVLHIDDDANDTALLQAASGKAQVGFNLHNVPDGEQALAYLEEIGNSTARPALILLDLKMPRATGLDILRYIRKHPMLERLPVIVLSGSELQEDIQNAYAAGANSYLVKPLGFEALVELIKRISAIWLAGNTQKPA